MSLPLLCLTLPTAGCRRSQPTTSLAGAARPGSKDYDEYVKAGKLEVTVENKRWFSGAIPDVRQLRVNGTIANNGERLVTGVELHGYTVDPEEKPLTNQAGKQIYHQTHVWMPNQFRKGPLPPGTSLPFDLIIATVSKDEFEKIGDMRVEISGVTFGQ